MIIGISGKRGSGKDTLAKFLIETGYTKVSFASPLKAHVRDFFSWTTEHTDGALKETVDPTWNVSPRQVMIAVGQFYRTFDPLFWVKQAFKNIPVNTVISDVRFINEADYIRANGGIIVRLERKSELNIYKGVIDDVSETQLDNYQFDVVLDAEKNINLTDLQNLAKELHNKYGMRLVH